MADETADEKAQRLALLCKLREEIEKRQLSNTENYDKAVLSLATAFLGFSLAFLKDFVSFRDASLNFLLPLSWALFGLAIMATIASFFTSQEELSAQLCRAEDYYLKCDEKALECKIALENWTKWLNLGSAISFVLGVITTILFISINLTEGTMSKHDDIKKGAGEPVAQPGDIKFVNQTRASIEPKASLTHQM